MAFAFFRRRQKLVIIVMVILMVSFLVGPQVMKQFAERGGKNREIGRLRDDTKIMLTDLWEAGLDLEILAAAEINPQVAPGVGLLQVIQAHRMANIEPAVVYALLRKEAEPFGPVSESDVDGVLGAYKLVDLRYRHVVSELRSRSISEKRFRQAIVHLIQIYRAFTESQITTPPSLAELDRFYFDENDRIRFEFIRVPAERFVSDVELPQEQELLDELLNRQFAEFKDLGANTFDDDNPYGFGYHVANQVEIEYMLVRADLLLRVVKPSETRWQNYYKAHEAEFIELVPSGETTADGEPIMVTRLKSPGEAKSEIIDKLRPVEVDQLMAAIFRYAAEHIRKFDAQPTGDQSAYEYAASKMALPAAAGLLKNQLTDVNLNEEYLSDAMEVLAGKAGIDGICYPLTDLAGQPLDDQARVTVIAETITLGEALAQIAGQLGQGELAWAQCEALVESNEILFATGALSTFPITPGETGLIDRKTLRSHPLLGITAMISADGQPPQAFDDSLFDEEALAIRPLAERQFSRRVMPGRSNSQLMWRITQALPAHPPQQRTPEIDEQMIADISTVRAMGLARQHAQKLLAQARQSSLTRVAEADDLDVVTVDRLSRKVPINQLEIAWIWRGVTGLRLPTEAVRKDFLKSVFALIDDGTIDGLDVGLRLGVIAVPSDHAVCLVEVIEHVPAVLEEHRARLPETIVRIERARNFRSQMVWFSFDAIVVRVGFRASEQ